jgi:hypothetical protein
MFLQLAKQAGAETRDQTRVIDIDTNSPSGGV